MRQVARQQLGFYPIPVPVIDLIATRLTADPGAVLLDPCAGRGDAVARLAFKLGVPAANVCAGELDHRRSMLIRQVLPEALVAPETDFLDARINGVPSLVYCNPPFDSEFGGGGRVEHRFLQRALGCMDTGGVLVFVGPERLRREREFMGVLNAWCDPLVVAPFPEVHRKFTECVWIGTKARYSRMRVGCRMVNDISHITTVNVSRGVMPTVYQSTSYSDRQLVDAVTKSPAMDAMLGIVKTSTELRPPLKLGKGHLALMLAAGHLNGLVCKPGKPPHVVRGTAAKEEYQKSQEITVGEKEAVKKTVMSERIQLTIRYVEPDGVIHTVKDAIAVSEKESDEQESK